MAKSDRHLPMTSAESLGNRGGSFKISEPCPPCRVASMPQDGRAAKGTVPESAEDPGRHGSERPRPNIGVGPGHLHF